MVFLPLVNAAVKYAILKNKLPPAEVAKRVVATIREGGVVAQKIAQVVASRPDIISDVHLLAELRELQSREISPDVHQASIATVTLDRDRGVAIKRVRDDSVIRDGELLARWLRLFRPLSRHPQFAVIVDVLETLANEIDFKSEKSKNETFRDSLSASSVVLVPETLSSTDSEVTMRIMDSTLAKDLGEEAVDVRLVRRFFQDMTMAAVRTGVVHLDLHAGNVGVTAERDAVVVYDMGSIREVDTKVTRAAFAAMIGASEYLFFDDYDGLARHLVERRIVIEVRDVRNLRLMTDVALRYSRGEATSVDIGMCLREIKGDVNVDASVFQLVQSISILEGCCKVLNPDFNVGNAFTGLRMMDMLEILEG